MKVSSKAAKGRCCDGFTLLVKVQPLLAGHVQAVNPSNEQQCQLILLLLLLLWVLYGYHRNSNVEDTAAQQNCSCRGQGCQSTHSQQPVTSSGPAGPLQAHQQRLSAAARHRCKQNVQQPAGQGCRECEHSRENQDQHVQQRCQHATEC